VRVGFGGLSQLVSEVDEVLAVAATRAAAARTTAESTPAAGDPAPRSRGYIQPPSQKTGSGKTWIYVGGGVLALWLVSMFSNTSSPSTSGSPARASSPSSGTGSTRTSTANTWTERMPPVGQTTPFDAAQIRYCLAEDVRLEAARDVANSDSDVDRFNAMINDYNSRCSSYRYRAGLLESLKRELQGRISDLRAEGIARFR
jgi:hypothetical protein